MKAKPSLTLVLAVVLAGILAGCSQLGTRSDAQIASDVQGKITTDAAVPTKQITVQSANGVVTLSGNVGSDTERTAAATDAAQVRGVKTVVNNLQVGATSAQAQQPNAAPEPMAQAQPQQAYEPAPRRSARHERQSPVLAHRSRSSSDTASSSNPAPPADPAPPSNGTFASNSAPVMTPPANTESAPPAPVKLTVPDGTPVTIRLIDTIDTERNHEGDVFRATLDSPIMVDDKVAIPADADVQGQIVSAKQEGHYTGQSALALELTQVSYNGHTYSLKTNQYTRQTSSRSKNTAAKVGTGAAVGAVLGGIFGGGKGAAIGAASGAGVGAGAQTISKAEPIRLASETQLSFRLQVPVTVTASGTLDRNAGRHRIDQ